VLLPVAYSFPVLGKLLSLLFIPFAAWFIGRVMGPTDYPGFLASGFLAYFGGPIVATPFLLNAAHLPGDMFQLFLVTGIYSSRFSNLVGAMHFVAMAILVTSAMTGIFKINRAKLLTMIGGTAAILLVAIIGTRSFLSWSFKDAYTRDKFIVNMHLLEEGGPAKVLKDAVPNPVPVREGQTTLERIRERGVVRVGYEPDRLPYSYQNAQGDLVGFDVAMAHLLADDLGVELEFVPFRADTLGAQLKADHFDLAMGGVVGTLPRAERMLFSDPYQQITVALVVKDHRVDEFRTAAAIREKKSLRLGTCLEGPLLKRIQRNMENLEIVHFKNERAFFESGGEGVDALLTTAESGSAWTLLHPSFQAVVPSDRIITGPLVYPIGRRDAALKAYVDHWIRIKEGDGATKRLYDYWILGRAGKLGRPRWSIIRDVLGWIE
jgi:proton glutamate symport protein